MGQPGDKCGWSVPSEGKGTLDGTEAGVGPREFLEGSGAELVLEGHVRFERENGQHLQSKVSCDELGQCYV